MTGPSGAGRSTAIHALEDLGFEAIDNLPLSLIPRLLSGPPMARPLALGVDPRNRDFDTTAMIGLVDKLNANSEVESSVLYLDARADTLLRRFSETRRRHPLAPDDAPQDGIRREFDLLAPLKVRAEFLIDTSEMTPHDLRAEVESLFAPSDAGALAVSVQSFSYKRGLPRGVDMVFDCRFLRNPHWDRELRALDGRDPKVEAYIEQDEKFAPFLSKLSDMSEFLLPAFKNEGKSHLSFGLGCTGGQHRSVAVAEILARTLANKGWRVSIRHRELERRASGAGAD
ncbi:MAG: RNase adapter RapZ [Litoreibacter sp.]|nr:RNase adapter RapZ [Litoreibacter sp.]